MPCQTEFSIGQRVEIVEVVEKGEKTFGGFKEIGKDRCVGMVGTLTMVRFDEKGLQFYVAFDEAENKKHGMYCSGALALQVRAV